MPNLTLRRCAGAILLVALPFQTAGCALGYTYERHSFPGDPLDTLSARQLFGETVRLTLRSGRTLTMDDVSLENDTLFGAGLKLPFDSVAQLEIRRSDPTRAIKATRAAAAAPAAGAGVALTAVLVVGVVVGIALVLKALGDAFGEGDWIGPMNAHR